jgi:peptide methionine sulfoxide reductase MsrB
MYQSVFSSLAHETYHCCPLYSPVQDNLRWGCDTKTADRICNFNRHYAEHSGYFLESTKFLQEAKNAGGEITFYDSNTGKPLFVAPRGRSLEDFLMESRAHGWPSFRDEEVIWENVRCLADGETVSLAGTHLGHNLPDKKGSRYCINLVSVAGNPNKEV